MIRMMSPQPIHMEIPTDFASDAADKLQEPRPNRLGSDNQETSSKCFKRHVSDMLDDRIRSIAVWENLSLSPGKDCWNNQIIRLLVR